MDSDTRPTIEATAYHEAGHAVLGHLFGDTTSVTIQGSYDGPGEDGPLGLCSFHNRAAPNRKNLIRHGCVLLAGPVAEGLFVGDGVPHLKEILDRDDVERGEPGTPTDAVQVFDTVVRLSSGWEEWEENYEEIARLAERLLRRRWRVVEAVAEALIERVTLSSEEIQELLGRSGGSVRRERRAADRAEDKEILAALEAEYGDGHELLEVY